MSRIGRVVRQHRAIAKTRRDVRRAINASASPAVRDELITMAQQQNLPLR
jgi:hypothetical protein